MFKNLPENVRQALTTVGPLIVVIGLFFFVGQFGFSKISTIRGQISKSLKDEATLTQKVALLTAISGTAQVAASIATGALPSGNPALIVTSQLKGLASQNGVSIASLKSGPEVADTIGLSRVDVTFDLIGTRDSILTFLKGIGTVAPITILDKVRLNESGEGVRATVSVKSFWAPFPAKLPDLTEPITDLTEDERALLARLGDLTQPTFSEVPPSEASERGDPFTQR